MEYSVGLDISLRSCALCILDSRGEVYLERELACGVQEISKCLEDLGEPVARIGFEAGALIQHLFFGFWEKGYDIVCMEPRQMNAALSAMRNSEKGKQMIRQIIRPLNDGTDARGVAHILRMGWIIPVHKKSREAHGVRALLSTRKALLKKTMDLANEAPGLLKIFSVRLPRTVTHGVSIDWCGPL